MNKISELSLAMVCYNNNDPKRIQHTTKVHAYASLIGVAEGLDQETQFILECAAQLHDIGIRASEKKVRAPERKTSGTRRPSRSKGTS